MKIAKRTRSAIAALALVPLAYIATKDNAPPPYGAPPPAHPPGHELHVRTIPAGAAWPLPWEAPECAERRVIPAYQHRLEEVLMHELPTIGLQLPLLNSLPDDARVTLLV